MLEMLMGGKVKEDYPDSGPGPKNLKFGDTDAGYFGTVSQSELFTASEVIAAITISVTQRADANMLWCKFFWKGKVIYYPSQYLFNDQIWNTFLTKNIVYSTSTTRTMNKQVGDRTHIFRIRMPMATITNPSALTLNTDAEFFALYAKVFSKATINAGWATSAWDSLVEPVAKLNRYIPTQATYNADTNQAIWVSYLNTVVSAQKGTDIMQGDRGFTPVLELADDAPGMSQFVGYYEDPMDSTRLAGYYGLIPSSDFLTAAELDTLVGADGVGQSTGMDDGWFKFYLDGKVLYTPKRPTRHNANAAQFDTLMGKTITVKGKQYLVRHWNITVPPTQSVVPYTTASDYYTRSDYRRLMLNLLASNAGNHTGQEGSAWANYTLADLSVTGLSATRMLSSANKTLMLNGRDYQLFASIDGLLGGVGKGVVSNLFVWRPVLELVGRA